MAAMDAKAFAEKSMCREEGQMAAMAAMGEMSSLYQTRAFPHCSITGIDNT
jgi:hypothetical protein